MQLGCRIGPFAALLAVAQGFQDPLSGLFLPGVELAWGNLMVTAHLADGLASLSGLFEEAQFLFGGSAPVRLGTHGPTPPWPSLYSFWRPSGSGTLTKILGLILSLRYEQCSSNT